MAALSASAPSRTHTIEDVLRESIARLDPAALAARFREEHLLVLDFLPPDLVHAMVREASSHAPRAHRRRVPFVRKGGAIAHRAITDSAPTLRALQRSRALLALFQSIAGPELELRRDDDPHASALYVYRRRGDHVGWHFDDCGCEKEASFTVILGLVDRSSSRLDFELFREHPSRAPVRRSIATGPGTLVFFCGSNAYHRVTPLRRGEERISFSFVYVKKGHQPSGLDRVRQRAIDTFLYFGLRRDRDA